MPGSPSTRPPARMGRRLKTITAAARIAAAIAIVAGPGCVPSCRTGDAAVVSASEPSFQSRRLVDALGSPPALDAAAEQRVRRAILDGLELTGLPREPAVGQPRPPLAERPPVAIRMRELITMFRGQLLPEPNVRKGDTTERLLRVEPAMGLAPDGRAALTFQTLRPIAGASLYLGFQVPEDPFGLPRYRRRSGHLESSAGQAEGSQYNLRADVRKLLRGAYDVAEVVARGGGVLVWRLELLDAGRGTSRVIDGATAFRCSPCQGPEAAFVQLPSLRLGPFVDLVGTTEAVISFATDAATAAWVALTDNRGETTIVASPSVGLGHEVALVNLEPGARYRYQPVVVDARGEIHVHRGATFETEPERLTRFEIVALSDSRSGFGAADEQYGGTNARVLRDLLKMSLSRGSPRAIVFVGDLVDGYTTWPRSFAFELEMWKRAVQPVHAHVPIYEAMGNHEALLDMWTNGWGADKREPSAEEVFAEQFVNPPGGPEAADDAPPYEENTYSFDVGTAHLAVINSNYYFRSHPGRPGHPVGSVGNREGWLDDRTLAWLDADLAAARRAGMKHLFVFTHEPGFPNGGHVDDGLYWRGRIPEVLARRAELYAILGRHGVTAVVHGDEHNYSRLLVDSDILGAPLDRPVWHLVSGAAGAPFYAQDRTVPWADRVAAFDARQHYLRFLIDGDACTVEAISRDGGLIDRFDAYDLSSSEPR